jgi:DNA-binding CsgD family transcriptional regulator
MSERSATFDERSEAAMHSMLESGYLSVLDAKTKDELLAHVVRFAQHLGFQTVTATAVIDHHAGDPEFSWIDNAPAAYRDIGEDRSNGKRDPVMQHCKYKSLPIVWNQSTYIEAGQGEKWEEQARFGYRHGICLALHLPDGRHFSLGVDRDQPLPDDPVEVTRMVASLQLFAVHAQEASVPLLFPTSVASDGPSLTPRELETLRWTMEGKTAWEVGRILGIAEDTVIRHAHNAARKLGCSGKHHAVVKALRLGLIR